MSLLFEGCGWVTVNKRLLCGFSEPGLRFLVFPTNFLKHLQHVSRIHNCGPGLVLL